MNAIHRALLTAIATSCLGAAAAQAGTSDTQQRNLNQQQRIQQGLASGALTDHEAARLEHGQARVNRIEAHAAANGRIGVVEQARIQSVENRQSRRIFRKKHNLRHD